MPRGRLRCPALLLLLPLLLPALALLLAARAGAQAPSIISYAMTASTPSFSTDGEAAYTVPSRPTTSTWRVGVARAFPATSCGVIVDWGDGNKSSAVTAGVCGTRSSPSVRARHGGGTTCGLSAQGRQQGAVVYVCVAGRGG